MIWVYSILVSGAMWLLGMWIGWRWGYSEGTAHGYAQCMLDRKQQKSDVFARIYGAQRDRPRS